MNVLLSGIVGSTRLRVGRARLRRGPPRVYAAGVNSPARLSVRLGLLPAGLRSMSYRVETAADGTGNVELSYGAVEMAAHDTATLRAFGGALDGLSATPPSVRTMAEIGGSWLSCHGLETA